MLRVTYELASSCIYGDNRPRNERPVSLLNKQEWDRIGGSRIFLEGVTLGTRASEALSGYGLTEEWNLSVCELLITHNNNMK